jgi:hypothetical protein
MIGTELQVVLPARLQARDHPILHSTDQVHIDESLGLPLERGHMHMALR